MAEERLSKASGYLASPKRWAWAWQAALAPVVTAAGPLLTRAVGACRWLLITPRPPPPATSATPAAASTATGSPPPQSHQQPPLRPTTFPLPHSSRGSQRPPCTKIPMLGSGGAPSTAGAPIASGVGPAEVPQLRAVHGHLQTQAEHAATLPPGASALLAVGPARPALAAASWPWRGRQAQCRAGLRGDRELKRIAVSAAAPPRLLPPTPAPPLPPEADAITRLLYGSRRYCASAAWAAGGRSVAGGNGGLALGCMLTAGGNNTGDALGGYEGESLPDDVAAGATMRPDNTAGVSGLPGGAERASGASVVESGAAGGWPRQLRDSKGTYAAEGAAGRAGIGGGLGIEGGGGRLQRLRDREVEGAPVRYLHVPHAQAGRHDCSDAGGSGTPGSRVYWRHHRSAAGRKVSTSPAPGLHVAGAPLSGRALAAVQRDPVAQPALGRPASQEIRLQAAAEAALTPRGLDCIQAICRAVESFPEVRTRLPSLDALLLPLIHEGSRTGNDGGGGGARDRGGGDSGRHPDTQHGRLPVTPEASASAGLVSAPVVVARIQAAAEAIAGPCAKRVRDLPPSRRCDVFRCVVEGVYDAAGWSPYEAVVAAADRLTRHQEFADPQVKPPRPSSPRPPNSPTAFTSSPAVAALKPSPFSPRSPSSGRHSQQLQLQPAWVDPAADRAAGAPPLVQKEDTGSASSAVHGLCPWVVSHAALEPVMARWLSGLDPHVVLSMLLRCHRDAVTTAATAAATPSGDAGGVLGEARRARPLCALLRGLHHLQMGLQPAGPNSDIHAAAAGAAASAYPVAAGEPRPLIAAAVSVSDATPTPYTAAAPATAAITALPAVVSAAEALVLGAAWAEQRRPGVLLGRYGPSLELSTGLLLSLERLGFRVRCRAHADFIAACLRNWRTAEAPEVEQGSAVATAGARKAAAAGASSESAALGTVGPRGNGSGGRSGVGGGPGDGGAGLGEVAWLRGASSTDSQRGIGAGAGSDAVAAGGAPALHPPGDGVGAVEHERSDSSSCRDASVANPALARVMLRTLLSLGYYEHDALERLALIGSRCNDGRRLVSLRLRERKPTEPLWNPPVFLAEQLALTTRYGSYCWRHEAVEPSDLTLRSKGWLPSSPPTLASATAPPPQLSPQLSSQALDSHPQQNWEQVPAQQHGPEAGQAAQPEQEGHTPKSGPGPAWEGGGADPADPEAAHREQRKLYFRALASARLSARLRPAAAALRSASVLGKSAMRPPGSLATSVPADFAPAAMPALAPVPGLPTISHARNVGALVPSVASPTVRAATPASNKPGQDAHDDLTGSPTPASAPAPLLRPACADGGALADGHRLHGMLALGCLAEGARLLQEAVAGTPRKALARAPELKRLRLTGGAGDSALGLARQQLAEVGLFVPPPGQPPPAPPTNAATQLLGAVATLSVEGHVAGALQGRHSAVAAGAEEQAAGAVGERQATAGTAVGQIGAIGKAAAERIALVAAASQGAPMTPGVASAGLRSVFGYWGEAAHPPQPPSVSPLLQAARIVRHTRAALDVLSTVKYYRPCGQEHERELCGPLRDSLDARILQQVPGLAAATTAATAPTPLPTPAAASGAAHVAPSNGAASVATDLWDPWTSWTPEQQDLAAAALQLLFDDVRRQTRGDGVATTATPNSTSTSISTAGATDVPGNPEPAARQAAVAVVSGPAAPADNLPSDDQTLEPTRRTADEASAAAAAASRTSGPATAPWTAPTLTPLQSAAVQLLHVMRPRDAVATLGALRTLGQPPEALPSAALCAAGRALAHRAQELSYSDLLDGISVAAWLAGGAASGRQGPFSPWRGVGGSGYRSGPETNRKNGCEASYGGSGGQGIAGGLRELSVMEALGDELVLREWRRQRTAGLGQDEQIYDVSPTDVAPTALPSPMLHTCDGLAAAKRVESENALESPSGGGGASLRPPFAPLRPASTEHPSALASGAAPLAATTRPAAASASTPPPGPQSPLEALRLLNAAGIRHPRLALAAAVGLLPDPTSHSRRKRLLRRHRFETSPLGAASSSAAEPLPPWSDAAVSAYDACPLPAPALVERMVSEGFLGALELVALLQVAARAVHLSSARSEEWVSGTRGGSMVELEPADPLTGGTDDMSSPIANEAATFVDGRETELAARFAGAPGADGGAADAGAVSAVAAQIGEGVGGASEGALGAATDGISAGGVMPAQSGNLVRLLRRKVLEAINAGERLSMACITCLLEEAGRELPGSLDMVAAAETAALAAYRRRLLHALHEAAARELGTDCRYRHGAHETLYRAFNAVRRELQRAVQAGPLPTLYAAETALSAAWTMSRMLPYASADVAAGGMPAKAATTLASNIIKTQRSCAVSLAVAAERAVSQGVAPPAMELGLVAAAAPPPRLLLLQLQLQLSQLSRDAVRHLLQPLSDADFLRALEHNAVLLGEVGDVDGVIPVRQTRSPEGRPLGPQSTTVPADADFTALAEVFADAEVDAVAEAYTNAARGEDAGASAVGCANRTPSDCVGVGAAGEGHSVPAGSALPTTSHLTLTLPPFAPAPLVVSSSRSSNGAGVRSEIGGRLDGHPTDHHAYHTGSGTLQAGQGPSRQRKQQQQEEQGEGCEGLKSNDGSGPGATSEAPPPSQLSAAASASPLSCSSSSSANSGAPAADVMPLPDCEGADSAAVHPAHVDGGDGGGGSSSAVFNDGLGALEAALRAASAAVGAGCVPATTTAKVEAIPTRRMNETAASKGASEPSGAVQGEDSSYRVAPAVSPPPLSSEAPFGTGADGDHGASAAGSQFYEALWRTPALSSALPWQFLSPRRPLRPEQREVNRRLVAILREGGGNVEKVMSILRLSHKHSQAIALPTQAALQLALGNCLPTVNPHQLHEVLHLIQKTNMYPPPLIHRAARRALALYGSNVTADTATDSASSGGGRSALAAAAVATEARAGANAAEAFQPAASAATVVAVPSRDAAGSRAEGAPEASPGAPMDWVAAQLLVQLVRCFASMSPAAEVDGALFRTVVHVTAGAVRQQLSAAAATGGVRMSLHTRAGSGSSGRAGARQGQPTHAEAAGPPGAKEAVQMAEGFLESVQVVCNRLRPVHRNAALAAVVPVRALVARNADVAIQTLFLGVLASSPSGRRHGGRPSSSLSSPSCRSSPPLAHLQLLVAHLPQLGSAPGLSWLVQRLLEAHEPYLSGSLREPGVPPWRVADQLLRAAAQCVPTVRLELLEGLKDRVLQLPSADLMTLSARCGLMHLLPPLTLAACVNRLGVHYGEAPDDGKRSDAEESAAKLPLPGDGDAEPDPEAFAAELSPSLGRAAFAASGGSHDSDAVRGSIGGAPPPASVALAGLVDAINRRMLAPTSPTAGPTTNGSCPVSDGATGAAAVEAAAIAAAVTSSVGILPYERRAIADPPLLSLGVAYSLAAVLSAGVGQAQGERPLELTRVARDIAGRVACALASQALTAPPVRPAVPGSGARGVGGLVVGAAAGDGLDLGLAASAAAALQLQPPSPLDASGSSLDVVTSPSGATPPEGRPRRGTTAAAVAPPPLSARLSRPSPPLLLLQGPEALLRLLQTAAEQHLRYDNDQSELMQLLLTTALSHRSSRYCQVGAHADGTDKARLANQDLGGGGARLAWLLQVMRALLELPPGGGWNEYAAAAAYLREHRAVAASGDSAQMSHRSQAAAGAEVATPSQRLCLQLLLEDVQEELAALGGEAVPFGGGRGQDSRGPRDGGVEPESAAFDRLDAAAEALFGMSPSSPPAAASADSQGKCSKSRTRADRGDAAVIDAVAAAALGVPSGAFGAVEAAARPKRTGAEATVQQLRALGTPFGLAANNPFWENSSSAPAGLAAAAVVITSPFVRRSLLTAVQDRIAALVERPDPRVLGLLAPPPQRRLPLAEAEAETVTMMAAGVRRRPLTAKSPGLLELELVRLAMGGTKKKGRPQPKWGRSAPPTQQGGGRLYDTVRQFLDELEVELSCEADSGALSGGSAHGAATAATVDDLGEWWKRRRQLLLEAVEVLGLLFSAKGEMLESVVGVIVSERWWPPHLPKNVQLSAGMLARQQELMYGSLLELVQEPLLAAAAAGQLTPDDVVRALEGLALSGQHRVTKELVSRLFDGLSDWLLRKAQEEDGGGTDRRSRHSPVHAGMAAAAVNPPFAQSPPAAGVASGGHANANGVRGGEGIAEVQGGGQRAGEANQPPSQAQWASTPQHRPPEPPNADSNVTAVEEDAKAPATAAAVVALYNRAVAAMTAQRCDDHPALPALARAFAHRLEGMQINKLVDEMKRLAAERRAAVRSPSFPCDDEAHDETEAAAAAAATVASELLRRMAGLWTSEQIRTFQVLASDGAADGAFVEAVADMVMFQSQNLNNAHFANLLWALALVASSAATAAAVRGPNATELMRAAAASLKARPCKPAVAAMALAAASRLAAAGCPVDRVLVTALQRALAARIAEKKQLSSGRELGAVLHWLTQGSLQRQQHRAALLVRPPPGATAEGPAEQGGSGGAAAAAPAAVAAGSSPATAGAAAGSGLVPVLDAIADATLRSMGFHGERGAGPGFAITASAPVPRRSDLTAWLDMLEGLYRLGYSQSGGRRWEALLVATHGAVRARLRAEALDLQASALGAVANPGSETRTADDRHGCEEEDLGCGGEQAVQGDAAGGGGGDGTSASFEDVDAELLLRTIETLLAVDALPYDVLKMGSEVMVASLDANGEVSGAGQDVDCWD